MSRLQVLIGLTIFLITYGIIISEKINRTNISLFGATLMILFFIETQSKAIEHIDFNTIGILIGMMIIVNIIKRTGIFEYIAIKSAKASKGNLFSLILILSTVTAISSSLLDNVTTILLIVPVTMVIAETLEVNPIPLLIPEILASNIGGTATLIGDPPNIMIGSAASISFMSFVKNLGPVVVVIFIITFILLKFKLKNSLNYNRDNYKKILVIDENDTIKDKKLLYKSFGVMVIIIAGFSMHGVLGYESATIAIFGGALLLVVSGMDPEEILLDVEWSTIFFFIALFILVGGLEEIGVLDYLAQKIFDYTKGDMVITAILILWVSAIASAFLDNIPFVATMIPLIVNLQELGGMDVSTLWWALSLGACLGGNGTIFGASSNVIVSGMLQKKGYRMSFIYYLKFAFPLMIVSIIISTVYLYVFYL